MKESIYSFMWRFIKPYKWYYVLMLQAPILSAFYAFANNYSFKLVVDTFSKENIEYSDLYAPIGLFVFAQLFIDVLWRVSNIAEWKAEPFVRRNIILASYDYIQHHSYKFFQDNFSGNVISKIKGIVDGYDDFWSVMHHKLAPHLASAIVLTFAILIVSVDLFLFIFIWSIIFFIVIYKMSQKLAGVSFEETESKHKTMGLISDNISNIFSLFAFASRKHEFKGLDSFLTSDFIPKQVKTYKYAFRLHMVSSVFYFVMQISVFVFMVYLRKANLVTSGDFVFVMGITIAMGWDLWKTIEHMQDFIRNIADFKSSLTVIQAPQLIIDKPDSKDIEIGNPSIEFKDVCFGYDINDPIIQDLSLSIKGGEKIGVVGLSGAGKSTLVSIMLKYFPLNKGSIVIGGDDINKFTSDSLRSQISLIPQDIALFHRNIMENIRYGNPKASDEEVINAAKKANIDHLIMSMPAQYDTVVGERGVKLSGGQRQRIAIARAILKNASILILDEATSNLDAETESMIQSSLNEIFDNKNITVIAIAHRLSTLKHMDRIIVLGSPGKVLEEGTHESLIKSNSLYKRLWDMQKI